MNGVALDLPDIGNYDISKIGELALYGTHLDYYALKGLIETTNDSIKKMNETYKMDIVMADDFWDMYTYHLRHLQVRHYIQLELYQWHTHLFC